MGLMSGLVPGLGMVKGMALTLRRFFAPKATVMYPEMPADVAVRFRGRLQLLYDEYGALKCETCFQCAQASPIECIDMGGMDTKGRFHVHWGPPETYGERREESALRRSGRTVPDQAYEHFMPFDLATVDAILDVHDHDGCVVRDDLRHRLVLRPPPVRAARREGPGEGDQRSAALR
jgi:hypothetical protein